MRGIGVTYQWIHLATLPTSSRRFWSRGGEPVLNGAMETENCRQQKSLGDEDEEVSVLDGEISQAEGSRSDESDSDRQIRPY